jgi:hypothetical protein
MLEASSFDFRGRHPQQLTIKFAKYYGLTTASAVSKTAFQISLDLYRTFAPLKQTTATMAFASLELACRLHDEHVEAVESGADYDKWDIGRAEVMGMCSLCGTCQKHMLMKKYRDTPRPPGALHPLSHLNSRRPRLPSRCLPQRPHPPQRRTQRQRSPPLHHIRRPEITNNPKRPRADKRSDHKTQRQSQPKRSKSTRPGYHRRQRQWHKTTSR